MIVAHAQKLSKADHLILRFDVVLLHLLKGESHRVLIAGGHHHSHPLFSSSLLEQRDSPHTLQKALVVHLASCLKVRVDRVIIVERGRSGAFLVHVGPSNKLSTEEEVLPVRLLQVKNEVVVGLLEVALVGVEHHRLLPVILGHHLHRDPGDGGLEVGLLSVHHHPHVHVLGRLEHGVDPAEHVLELLPLLLCQSRHQWLQLSCLQVWHPELIFKELRPWTSPIEKMDHAKSVIGHIVNELLDIGLLTGNPGSFQLGLVRFGSHPTLNHLAFLSSDFFMVPPRSSDHLRQLQQQLGSAKCCQFDCSKSSCLSGVGHCLNAPKERFKIPLAICLSLIEESSGPVDPDPSVSKLLVSLVTLHLICKLLVLAHPWDWRQRSLRINTGDTGIHLSLFCLLLADVLLHAVVQDALHPKAVHPRDRWCDPHGVRSGDKLAIEGSLHDLAKELFTKHLLSKLHQNFVVVDQFVDSAELEDDECSNNFHRCLRLESRIVILKAEVELILLLVPIKQLPCMLPQYRSHFLASLFLLQVAWHLGQRRVQLLFRRCRRGPNLLGRSNSPASQQPRTPAGHFCTFDQFCHQSWSLPCNLRHQTLQTGSLEQSTTELRNGLRFPQHHAA